MTNDQAAALIKELDIRCVVFDIDGVMTDGSIVVDADGRELFKTFNVKDGLGVQMLAKAGFELGIITGRSSTIVAARAKTLGIQHVYQGKLDKTAAFEDLLNKLGITEKQVAYIGDDMPDVPLFLNASVSLLAPPTLTNLPQLLPSGSPPSMAGAAPSASLPICF